MIGSDDSPLKPKTPLQRAAPWLTMFVMTIGTVVILKWLGRIWWCEGGAPGLFGGTAGEPFLWSGDVWSMHNSQHLVDPYSFTHVTHGLIFAGLFLLIPPTRRLPFGWRMVMGLAIEAFWEIIENTSLIIDRYRESTMALGYNGDSIGNSVGDIVCFALGFVFASRLRWYWSVGFFVITEVVLLFTIRDNLTLNVLMLLWPVEAVKQWQTVGM
ncbi:MAG: DUF2585 family protein [Phycisphaerales bacterium]